MQEQAKLEADIWQAEAEEADRDALEKEAKDRKDAENNFAIFTEKKTRAAELIAEAGARIATKTTAAGTETDPALKAKMDAEVIAMQAELDAANANIATYTSELADWTTKKGKLD